jgi:hypothetical protein
MRFERILVDRRKTLVGCPVYAGGNLLAVDERSKG